jgi:hypothetical protein
MKKKYIGILLGILIASVIYIPIIYLQSKKRYELGLVSGMVHGLAIASDAIEKEFGTFDGKSEYTNIFSVKSTDVVAIKEDGHKTIRVMP